ncbi:hypothetical protein scyTo_0012210 [Scyliorhinus torazame]|uniref:Uncharacterized protein n=1 Tax=Scyliorhinus torazame TaxID=75743 RepID=A0A401P4C0_SCYTO|nr:hypothetical protein [Scyliorhinus torazame]
MFCTRCRLSGNRTIIRQETRRKGQSVNINPLAAEYYCFPQEFLKPPTDDDSNSYENVEINETPTRTSVGSDGSYENCEYAGKWNHQEKPEEKRIEINDDDDDDDDPDYVNTVPCPSL